MFLSPLFTFNNQLQPRGWAQGSSGLYKVPGMKSSCIGNEEGNQAYSEAIILHIRYNKNKRDNSFLKDKRKDYEPIHNMLS